MLTDTRERNESHPGRENSRQSAVDYIFAVCPYAARGLAVLMSTRGRRCCIITPGDDSLLMADWQRQVSRDSRVVVWFPDEPLAMLSTLDTLILICRMSPRPLSAVLLSSVRPDWLWRTLRAQAGGARAVSALHIIPADTPLRALMGLLRASGRATLLSVRATALEVRAGEPAKGITARELDAMLGMLRGENIVAQSRRLGLSGKTLYTQRMSGLRRLAGIFPRLISLLPRARRPAPPRHPPLPALQQSPEEHAFEQALHRRLVFPVFQPVTDRHLRVQGFEVLIRWMRDGRERQPAEFLPKIQSEHTWLLLTTYVISEAVRQINRTGGQYYFAVNVPAGVAESGALIRMMETVQGQLHDPSLAGCLVLEFSESTVISRGQAMESILHIRQAGHRVLLDDCFSGSSVMFPVRQVQFSGYKLDMSIVNTFLRNHHDASLVKSLAGYCALTDAECIAEGVDSREKFVALVQAGVTGFQGYYISRPVYRELMDEEVRQLHARSGIEGLK